MTHRIFIEDLPQRLEPGDPVQVTGEEAEHARKSRRLGPGAKVAVIDGKGRVIEAEISEAKRDLVLRVVADRREPALEPRVEVWAATPKGGRVDQMIDALSEVGAAMWRPLDTEWGVVEPRDSKLARLDRVAREASKQCGRAWMMEIGERAGLGEALDGEDGVKIVMADASGEWYEPSGGGAVRLLVGPEGGWTKHEREKAERAGATLARFGAHAMRIEVAAPIAAAIIIETEQRARTGVSPARSDTERSLG
ncbi:MAG: 16S rRNA (uracil(1498)-N(3))-methyltransferase [Phycisphaerales bacterium]